MYQRKRILIIEDDFPISHILKLKLDNAGYQADTAYDGREGIEKVNETKYDLIILDLMMPIKNGFEVLKDLRGKKESTPVIVMSNLSQEKEIKKAQDLGAKDYFVKLNINLKEIVIQVQKWIAMKES